MRMTPPRRLVLIGLVAFALLAIGLVFFQPEVRPNRSAATQADPTQQNPFIFGLINSEDQAGDVKFFSNYGLVLVAEFPDTGPFETLRALNPDIILLGMTNPYFPTGFVLYPDYTHPENIRPDWVLRTEGGEVIPYAGPLYATMGESPSMMDLRVSDWQDEYINFNKVLIEEYDLDGMVLDTWSSTLPVWAHLNNQTPPADYSNEKWRQMMRGFSEKFRTAFPQNLLIYNGLTVAPGEQGLGDIAYLETMDGAAYEAYSIYLQMDSSPETKRHYFDHAIMNAMVRTREADRYFLLQAAGDEVNPESRLYAYGAFLLNAYDKSYFYFDAGDEDEANWFPEWNIALGAPVAPAQKIGEIYLRQFENASVLVNPNDKDTSYDLTQLMFDDAGAKVDGSVALPPFSAMILRPAP